MSRLLYIVNVDWFFFSHHLPIALAAKEHGFEVHVATRFEKSEPEALRRLGLVPHAVALSRSGSGGAELMREFTALLRVLNAVQPDLVHLVTIKPNLLGGVAARLSGIPRVLGVSGRGLVFAARGARAALRKQVALLGYSAAYQRGRTRVILQNREDVDYFVDKGVFHRGDARLIRGSGVDLGRLPPLSEANTAPTVVLAGRMLREKGVADFVEAATMLRVRGVVARFVLVGDVDPGNPHSYTRDEIGNWTRNGAVEWLGFRNDMLNVFAMCHAVCLPTYYGEGVPRVLIEAAACGRPIVTTDTPGCRDIVRHRYNGLLVQPRDPAGLAAAIHQLIENPQRRIEMGQRGRALVEAEFSLDIVIRQTLEVYQELIGSDVSS